MTIPPLSTGHDHGDKIAGERETLYQKRNLQFPRPSFGLSWHSAEGGLRILNYPFPPKLRLSPWPIDSDTGGGVHRYVVSVAHEIG